MEKASTITTSISKTSTITTSVTLLSTILLSDELVIRILENGTDTRITEDGDIRIGE